MSDVPQIAMSYRSQTGSCVRYAEISHISQAAQGSCVQNLGCRPDGEVRRAAESLADVQSLCVALSRGSAGHGGWESCFQNLRRRPDRGVWRTAESFAGLQAGLRYFECPELPPPW